MGKEKEEKRIARLKQRADGEIVDPATGQCPCCFSDK